MSRETPSLVWSWLSRQHNLLGFNLVPAPTAAGVGFRISSSPHLSQLVAAAQQQQQKQPTSPAPAPELELLKPARFMVVSSPLQNAFVPSTPLSGSSSYASSHGQRGGGACGHHLFCGWVLLFPLLLALTLLLTTSDLFLLKDLVPLSSSSLQQFASDALSRGFSPQRPTTEAPGRPTRSANKTRVQPVASDAAARAAETKSTPPHPSAAAAGNASTAATAAAAAAAAAACDFSQGKWVYDPANYPLWTPGACPLVEPGFDCAAGGRTDDDFKKYSWQPDTTCELKRFSPAEMRQLLVSKRVAIVGDSLGRNSAGSLLCLLSLHLPERSVSDPSRPSVYEEAAAGRQQAAASRQQGSRQQAAGSRQQAARQHVAGSRQQINGNRLVRGVKSVVMEFVDFNFTVEYHVSNFVVSLQEVNPVINTDAVDPRIATSLLRAEWARGRSLIVIFNMGHWFIPRKTVGE